MRLAQGIRLSMFGHVAGNAELATALGYASNGGRVLIDVPTTLTAPVVVTGVSDLELVCAAGIEVDASAVAGTAIMITGTEAAGVAVAAPFARYDDEITLASASGFAVGDVIRLGSSQPFALDRDDNTYWLAERHIVTGVTDNTLTLGRTIAYDWDHATHPVSVYKVTPVRNIRLTDFRLRMAETAGQAGVTIRYFFGAHVTHSTFRKCTQWGVKLEKGSEGYVTGCSVSDTSDNANGYGIFLAEAEDCVADGNHGKRNKRTVEANGSRFGLSRNVIIANNTAHHDRTSPFGSHAGSDAVTFSGNIAEGCGGGIVSRGARAVIVGNHIRDVRPSFGGVNTYLDAIWVGEGGVGGGAGLDPTVRAGIGGYVGAWQAKVIGNKISGRCRNGVLVRNQTAAGVEIVDNDIRGAEDAGIYLVGGFARDADDIVIAGNVIDGTKADGSRGDYGIRCTHRSHRLNVERNTVSNQNFGAITIAGSTDAAEPNTDIVVRNNIVRGVTQHGYDFERDDPVFERLVVSGNVGHDIDGTAFRGLTSAAVHPSLRPVFFDNHTDDPVVHHGPVQYRTAMPTNGTFNQYDVVLSSQPVVASGSIVLGWLRLTTGSGHVLGTDWAAIHATAVTA